MVIRNWVGGNAGFWEVAGNWDPFGIPTLADDVAMTTGFATITTTIAINSITMSASTIDVRSPGGTTTLTGGLTLSGAARVSLDAAFAGGGKGGNNLVIGGLLTNASTSAAGLFIGNRGITEDDTVTAGGLVSTGSIRMFGSASAQSTLKVAGVAGFGTEGVARGVVYMETNALLQFDSGQIETIDGTIWLNGINARVASGASLSTNSALVGLKTVAGLLILQEGASVGATSGGLSITDFGRVALDPTWIGGAGGSSLTIGGVLSNTSEDVDALSVGNATITSDVTLTAIALENAGTIQLTGSGSSKAFLKIAALAENSGVIIVNGGGVIEDPDRLHSTGALKLAGGTIDTPTVVLDTTGTLIGNGTIDGSILNDGYLEATGGVLVVTGGIVGAGLNKIGSNATLELGTGSPDAVVFDGASATLRLDTPAEFKGTIIGFDDFDMIDLRGIAGGTSATLDSKNVLHVLDSSNVEIASLQLTASSIGQSFTVGSNGAGGTMIAGGDIATTISIAPLLASKAEDDSGTTAFTFTVSLDQASFAAQTADWTVAGSGGQAADAADFGGAMATGTVSFAPGETSAVVTILVTGDTAAELDEEFTVTLSNLTFGLLPGTASATGTILNDDKSAVSVTGPGSQAEGNGGPSRFAWTVSLDRAGVTSQTVAWAITGDGAHAADSADLVAGMPTSGTLTFAPGETVKTLAIDVVGDATVEHDEGLVLTLSAPSFGLELGTTTMAGTVVNDDLSAVSIAALSAGKEEGDGGTTLFTFTVSLDQAPVVGQSVGWSVTGSGGQAADAADFGGLMPTGTVSFAPGETLATITVGVSGDTQVEPDETFAVTLVDLSAGLAPGTSSATGVIDGDDSVAVSIAALSAGKAEGDGGTTPFTFTVSLDQAGLTVLTVDWSVGGSGQSPAAAPDFGSPSGTASFAAGETFRTITVNVLGDTEVERDEEFTVSLSNPGPGLAIVAGSAMGTIQNDDRPTATVYAFAATKAEGSSGTTAFIFMIGLDQPDATGGQSLAWSVAGAGANPATAADFADGVLASGTVTFAPGDTTKYVTIGVVGDALVEPDEGFTMTLSSLSSGLMLGVAAASGTIQNDDAALAVRAHDDAYIVLEGQSLTAPVARGVLANDENATTASLLSGPGDGTLQIAGNGSFGYTPATGFTGIDSFTYRAGNTGSSTADAQASIYVVPVNVGETTTLDLLSLSAQEQIAATYVAFFGRAADRAGFDFWVGEFVSGLPVQGPAVLFANIASSFGISDEARALYPFLANPFGASDGQISAFLDSVYNNLFNRGSDPAGLAYWTGETKATLLAGRFVGSILVNIMSGAQDTAAGQDITTLMGKVAVSLDYVREQHERDVDWLGASDVAAATSLLDPVTSDPLSVLTGIRNAEGLIAAHP